jgi:dTDP-4-dehydrorhamnose reductase
LICILWEISSYVTGAAAGLHASLRATHVRINDVPETRVLVVGGSSFIAQHLIEALLLRNDVAAISATYSKHRVPHLPVGVKQFKVDFDQPENGMAHLQHVFGTIGTPHVVINCVGLTSLMGCEEDKDKCQRLNVPRGLVNALRALDQQPHLVHLSTDKVFKGGANHPPYKEHDLDSAIAELVKGQVRGKETIKLGPPNEYGKSKLRAEGMIVKGGPHLLIIMSLSYTCCVLCRLQALRDPSVVGCAWPASSICT